MAAFELYFVNCLYTSVKSNCRQTGRHPGGGLHQAASDKSHCNAAVRSLPQKSRCRSPDDISGAAGQYLSNKQQYIAIDKDQNTEL